ncbi:MAG: NTP transferase domain-containing protein [Candidatus Peregrinibacteria bacterium]|nr:NTP transferase domain-containing protein [Candidatus Peregrinibacteria bacterium]
MKTLLILAGQSRRFWPLREKSLFPIVGKTLLEHQIERLRKGGCREIILVCGPHNIKETRKLLPKMTIMQQKDMTAGMRGAFLSALPRVKSEPVLVVGANDVIEPEAYAALIKAAKVKGVDGAILARKVKRYFPGGYLTVARGRVTSIVEKPGEGNEPSKLVNIVAHVHNDPASLLASLKKTPSGKDDGYERALSSLFTDKRYVSVEYTDPWHAVKYPWHLLPLLERLLAEIRAPSTHRTAKVHPTAVIEGDVILDADARVLPHATIIGPSYIGKGATIGTGALVRGSSVGDGCVIGYGTEVKGSLLASNVWAHMAYLGDSIIASNVSFGGGTLTGNFRLDEGEITSADGELMVNTGLTKLGAIIGSGSRLGINVSLNPGVKIGEGTFVAAASVVQADVPTGSFIMMKDGKYTVRENRSTAPVAESRNVFRNSVRKNP